MKKIFKLLLEKIHNAVKASKQNAIALISDVLYEDVLDEEDIKNLSRKVFGDINYKQDMLMFHTAERIIIINRKSK